MIALAILVGVFVGVIGEIAASVGSLWVYRHPVSALINIVVVFGVIMGSVSLLAPVTGYWLTAAAGFAIGYAYEWLNFLVLDWWTFPHDAFLGVRGRQACALLVSVLWAATPVVIAVFSHLVRLSL